MSVLSDVLRVAFPFGNNSGPLCGFTIINITIDYVRYATVVGILRYQVDLQQLEELEENFEDFDLDDYD